MVGKLQIVAGIKNGLSDSKLCKIMIQLQNKAVSYKNMFDTSSIIPRRKITEFENYCYYYE